MFTTLFFALAALLFTELSSTGRGIRRQGYDTALMVTAGNARAYVVSKVKTELNKPFAFDPSITLARMISAQENVLPSAAVDLLKTLPETTAATISYSVDPPIAKGVGGGAFEPGFPIVQASGVRNKSVTQAYLIPITVKLSTVDAVYGKRDLSYRINLIEAVMPFAQYAMCFGNFNAQYIGEPNVMIRGGIVGMKKLNVTSTYDSWSYRGNAPLQADFVGAETVSFDFIGRNNNYGGIKNNGSTNSVTGVYIWQGDVIPDAAGPQTFTKGVDDTRLSRQIVYNPYASYSSKNQITAEFLPTFETMAGPNDTARNYMDYFTPKGGEKSATRYKIDSANSDFKNLAGRYNGNLRDSSTGWVSPDVTALPDKVRDLHALIESPILSNTSASGLSDEDFKAVEAAKVAGQAKLYVVVENPDVSGKKPPAPIFFTDPVVAAKYKEATGQDPVSIKKGKTPSMSQTDRADLLKTSTYSGSILDVSDYADVVEVKRSFYDSHLSDSKTSVTTSDVASDKRVSAVDVNLSRLAEMVKSTQVKTLSGNAWDPGDSNNWNGIFYVDVVKPVGGAGWVSHDIDKSELNYNKNGDLVKKSIAKDGSVEDKVVIDPLGSYGTKAPEQTLIATRLYNGSDIPNTDAVKGFTFATNVATYTVGSINADGRLATDKAAETEKALPMNIFCDSMSFLPESYMGAGGNKSGSLDYGDSYLAANYMRFSSEPDYADWKYAVPFSNVGDNMTELNFVMYAGMAPSDDFGVRGAENNKVDNFLNAVLLTDSAQSLNHTFRYCGSRNMLFTPKCGGQFRSCSLYGTTGINGKGSYRTYDTFDMSLRTGADTAPGSLMTRYFYIQSTQRLSKVSQ